MEYKLIIYPALELGFTFCNTRFLFETKKELVAARDTAADLLIFLQDQAKLMESYSNVFICEKSVNGEWEEVEL